jgi:rhodanese-related sulfurtransferase
MKILKSCAIALAISTLPYGVCAESSHQLEAVAAHQGGVIDTQGLETLLNSQTPFSLVDARSDQYFDGTLIMGAKRLPAESEKVTIEQSLPDKKKLVVVYCAGPQCPASKNLAKRLVELGYTNVVDYHGGMQEWIENNKPTQRTNS